MRLCDRVGMGIRGSMLKVLGGRVVLMIIE